MMLNFKMKTVLTKLVTQSQNTTYQRLIAKMITENTFQKCVTFWYPIFVVFWNLFVLLMALHKIKKECNSLFYTPFHHLSIFCLRD